MVGKRPSDWRTGSTATNHPDPLRASTQSFVAEHLEGPPDGHPAHAVSPGEIRLAGERATSADAADGDLLPELLSNL